MMTSPNPTPDLIQGGYSGTSSSAMISPSNFNFIPIGPAPPGSAIFTPPLVRPTVSSFKLKSQESSVVDPVKSVCFNKRKSVQESMSDMNIDRGFDGPQRKLHLSEEMVADTMADLYISHPRAKVARRKTNSDVAQAMNLNSLEELEDKFSSQAAINNEEFSLPPQRSRKLPTRKAPQLRLSIHQELKNLRSSNAILPESIMSRYRPSPRSTAVVLWKPPLSNSPASLLNGGVIPDVVSSALRNSSGSGRHRTRCYSEVTSTPYSSHENLCNDSDMPDISERGSGFPLPCSSHSPGNTTHGLATTPPSGCAEAPELSHVNGGGEVEVPPGVNLHRRNSAPEISEPLPFVDDGCMEL